MEFTFILKYQLPSDDNDMDAVMDRLAEEGCDDALIGVGQPGRGTLEFVRDAAYARDAIESTLKEVRRAIANARLSEKSQSLAQHAETATK